MKTKTNYFFGTDDLPWQDKTIAINAETKPEDCLGYEKTIYFISDTSGTLTILVDATGDGGWQTYGTVAITLNVLLVYPMTGGAKYVKLMFSAAAVVTATHVFE